MKTHSGHARKTSKMASFHSAGTHRPNMSARLWRDAAETLSSLDCTRAINSEIAAIQKFLGSLHGVRRDLEMLGRFFDP